MKKVAAFKGQDVYAYTIKNENGMSLTALNYGACVTELLVADKNGTFENVVIRYEDIDVYEVNPYFLGAVIGRTSGRTEKAKVSVDGTEYKLAANDGANHLHGGEQGFAKVFWDVEEKKNDKGEPLLKFTYVSEDGEDGYPGKVTVDLTYSLTSNNTWEIKYKATTDRLTPLNLTNHSYFNLSGNMKEDILSQQLKLNSSSFYILDEESLPVNKADVTDYPPFNFTEEKKLSDSIKHDHPQIKIVGDGIDHPFLFDENDKEKVILTDYASGRVMKVETNDPAVVIYSGNQIGNTPKLNDGNVFRYAGICFETQKVPNETESYFVQEGDTYEKFTSYSFGTLK